VHGRNYTLKKVIKNIFLRRTVDSSSEPNGLHKPIDTVNQIKYTLVIKNYLRLNLIKSLLVITLIGYQCITHYSWYILQTLLTKRWSMGSHIACDVL
jgi:hypothetical protein